MGGYIFIKQSMNYSSCEHPFRQLSLAFADVRLDGGISLRQAALIDTSRIIPIPPAKFAAAKEQEITEDWSQIPPEELEQNYHLSQLDARGFRYYLPAFLVSVLRNYEFGSMRCITTLSSLYPKKENWEYHMNQYSLFSQAQKQAVAASLQHLLVSGVLEGNDPIIVHRALRNYWSQFLPE